MRIQKIILLLLVILFLTSCIPEILEGPYLVVEIDKQEVSIDEKINIKGIYNEIYVSKTKDILLYLEDYPEEYSIVKGQLYEPMTDTRYLCITPEYYEPTKAEFKLQIAFSTPGEYILRINGCYASENKIDTMWGQEYYTYKFIVHE